MGVGMVSCVCWLLVLHHHHRSEGWGRRVAGVVVGWLAVEPEDGVVRFRTVVAAIQISKEDQSITFNVLVSDEPEDGAESGASTTGG